MQVRVLFFGVLKDLVGSAEESLEVPATATVGDVFGAYCERFETLQTRRPSILFARNREFVRADESLSANDEVAFLPPVSGGSASEAPYSVGITHDPIDSGAIVRKLVRPEDGGVVVFEGVVRNNTKGRGTLYLEYECYQAMAIAQMTVIAQELTSRHQLGRLAIVHRLGRLAIGEASVAIVATAPHRGPAFEAAREAIDRLKREVPIWKKEFFADGAVWVDGEWDQSLLPSSSNVRS